MAVADVQESLKRAFNTLSGGRMVLAGRLERDGEMWNILLGARMAVSSAYEQLGCPDPHRDVLEDGELSEPWCDCPEPCPMAEGSTRVLEPLVALGSR